MTPLGSGGSSVALGDWSIWKWKEVRLVGEFMIEGRWITSFMTISMSESALVWELMWWRLDPLYTDLAWAILMFLREVVRRPNFLGDCQRFAML